MDRNFGGVIWTNHALERLRERGITQGDAWATWNRPEHSRKGTVVGSWIYYRSWGGTQIEVVAKQNAVPAGRQEKREWLILSIWSRPAKFGVRRSDNFSGKTSFWRKLYNFIFTK